MFVSQKLLAILAIRSVGLKLTRINHFAEGLANSQTPPPPPTDIPFLFKRAREVSDTVCLFGSVFGGDRQNQKVVSHFMILQL